MCSERTEECSMHVVGHAEVMADLLDDLLDGWVIGVANLGEQVLFDLVVEAAEEPACARIIEN